jgi:hypothetical protein
VCEGFELTRPVVVGEDGHVFLLKC